MALTMIETGNSQPILRKRLPIAWNRAATSAGGGEVTPSMASAISVTRARGPMARDMANRLATLTTA